VAVSRLEARLTQAQLDALRAQLHPHFLFNALNATSVLARKGDSERVMRMLGSLGDLLRASLDRGLPHEVPLERELDLLDRYAEIQTTRFGDRVRFEREVDAAALRVLVPSMILQPLVENAVRHGIEARPGNGCVTIRARRDGEALRLEVRDTGPGFCGGGVEHGVGLSNTRARLEHLYGEKHRFEIGNVEGGGAFVAMTIPWWVGGSASRAGRDPGDAAGGAR
jgi:sensor histidine kinase YesM